MKCCKEYKEDYMRLNNEYIEEEVKG